MSFLESKLAFRTALTFLCLVAVTSIFIYGIVVGSFKLPPYPLFERAYKEYELVKSQLGETSAQLSVRNAKLPFYYSRIPDGAPEPVHDPKKAYQGTNLATRVLADSELSIDMLGMDGEVLHSWDVDWFRVWPDAEHVPDFLMPKSKPGTHIHGAVVLDNGELVFNYEHLGLVKLSKDSEIMWRLPYRTHHSVHLHDDGMLWVSGQRAVHEPDQRFPNRKTPYDEYTLLEIEPVRGNIVSEWSVAELLLENGYGSLMELFPAKPHLQIADDRIHLNDVEPFPLAMEEDFFKHGDIIVSLRNISTVFVFNRHTRKIRYIATGWFLQQHDPDFIDGNHFSVFDNNAKKRIKGVAASSRIVVVNAPASRIEVAFEGTEQFPFYTRIMGKHQWLPNGNLLVTESMSGRAFEVDPEGNIVWQYINVVDKGIAGLVEEVSRFPINFTKGW